MAGLPNTAGSTGTLTRVQEDDAPGLPLIISIYKNYHFHPNFINHRFIPINLLEISFSIFLFGNAQWNSSTGPISNIREKI